MDVFVTLFTAIGGALVAGIFSVIVKKMDAATQEQRDAQKKADERMARIEANTEKLAEHDSIILSLAEVAKQLKESTDANGEGVKIIMRYMLQRYHAEYMLQGFVTSHQRTDFLEAYGVYHSKGGNGTAEGWKDEVCSLPVRDDQVVVNPFLAVLKKERGC